MAGALLGYVEHTQKGALNHIAAFRCREGGEALVIDRASLRNLEVERAVDGSRRGSLIDSPRSTPEPGWDRGSSATVWSGRASTSRRSANVTEPSPNWWTTLSSSSDLRTSLENLPDLERLAARVGLGLATPRELDGLRAGLDLLPRVLETARGATSSLLRRHADSLDPLTDLAEILHHRLAADPAQVVGAGVIAGGWDAELDEQRSARPRWQGTARRHRERPNATRTGISSLKIRYNKVFGYFIEVSKAKLDRVPEDYERRQTLTNAERFITPELKELEVEDPRRRGALHRPRARALVPGSPRRPLGTRPTDRRATARIVAQLDVLTRLRRPCTTVELLSAGRSRTRPGSPSPRVDTRCSSSCNATPRSSPTTPTSIRRRARSCSSPGPTWAASPPTSGRCALITLMAHAGSFVPAAEARIGLTDRIFTRVGASDMLARGESTFMVEMTETANILHHATPRSLVILDEVGRGTATFDGLSLAWAIVEYLHDRPEHAALVLFATHYHELTDLARMLPRLVNRSMAVKEWRGSILFLHRVADGPADRSYGIHVARLAGVPDEVCRTGRPDPRQPRTPRAQRDGRPRDALAGGGRQESVRTSSISSDRPPTRSPTGSAASTSKA